VNCLESNLAALASRFPDLANEVAAAEAAPLEITAAASGGITARLPGGALLHSSRDPRAEAERLARALLAGGADTVVVPGFGFGYLAEACLAARAERVLVCEAGPSALKAAFAARELADILSDERLGFIVGGDPDLVVTVLELSGAALAVVAEPKLISDADRGWLEHAKAAAGRWIATSLINERTLKRFGRLWVRNLAANLDVAASACAVDLLEGQFSGVPAIVLAAGPSLDEILPFAAELRKRALFVCVDTALRSLLRYGIEPDFLVVADPQYWNWRHIAGLASPSSFIISDATTWPAVFRTPSRGVFLGGSLFPLGRRIERLIGRRGGLGAGGSVSTSAWDFARLAGCSPLWMAGLDLGFPNGATHARASFFEQRALCSGRRLAPAETAQASALVGPECRTARSAEGGSVRTDSRMELYAWWFESRLARPQSPPTYSLSPKGLAIAGMPLGAVDDILSRPPIRTDIDERLAAADSLRPHPGAAEALAEGLDALCSEIAEVLAAAEAAAAAAAAGREALGRGAEAGPVLAALDEADRRILCLGAREVAGFLLPPLSEIAGRRAGSLDESLAHSEQLYRGIVDSARYHLEILSPFRRGGRT
jgi:hypothetical protein